MLYAFGSFLLPLLFVFGVYHLMTWFNIFHVNKRVFWKRVAITSAICHVLLATGFFVFSYFDATETSFGNYLFYISNFWRLMTIFDTAPMLVLIGTFSLFAREGVNPPGLIGITVAITYVIGTIQWFLVGGGVGALLERFFEGLRTPDPEEQDWD
jgi:hypothetical protein